MKVYVDAWGYVTEKFVNMGNIELCEGILRYKKADYPPMPNFILSYTYPETLDLQGFLPFSKFCLRPFYALFSYQAGVACSNWRTAFIIDSSVT